MTVKEYAQQHDYHFGHMTIGQCISTAIELHMTVGRVILEEAVSFTGKTYDEIVADMNEAFAHNIKAAEIGLNLGRSG